MKRLMGAWVLLWFASLAWAGEEPAIRLLVITGSHPFDARFYSLFEGYPDIVWDKKTQSGGSSSAYSAGFANDYDAVLLYDFEMAISDAQKQAFADAFGAGRGLIVLHHALCSHPDWPKFRQITGGQFLFQAQGEIPAGTYQANVSMTYRVADSAHFVTQGVSDFQVVEEPYKQVFRPANAQPLLTSTHEESDEVVAWSTRYGDSRVIAIEPGHGWQIFEEPNFRRFLAQSIRWVAGADQEVAK